MEDVYKKLEHLLPRIPKGWLRVIDVGPGWYNLIIRLDKILSAIDPEYEIHQVKEKFGGLRFYAASNTERHSFDRAVCAAENMSYSICENCGEPGKLRKDHWWRTNCDKCDQKYLDSLKR